MRVGDLVKLTEVWTNSDAVEDWGYGFVEEIYATERNVEVVWPQKSWTSRTMPISRVEVVSESR